MAIIPQNLRESAHPGTDHANRFASLALSLCLALLLLSVLFLATFLNLVPARHTIGWASAYTLFTIGPPLILALIEHLTKPAGPRKSAEKWLLHFQIMLANYTTAIPFGLLATRLASLLVKSLGLKLGLIDLRFNGTDLASVVGGFLVSVFIGDFFFY